jgi:hypothetical protein
LVVSDDGGGFLQLVIDCGVLVVNISVGCSGSVGCVCEIKSMIGRLILSMRGKLILSLGDVGLFSDLIVVIFCLDFVYDFGNDFGDLFGDSLGEHLFGDPLGDLTAFGEFVHS